MAGEEDVELRDLVAQSLEAKGVLGKIRVSFTGREGFWEGRKIFSERIGALYLAVDARPHAFRIVFRGVRGFGLCG